MAAMQQDQLHAETEPGPYSSPVLHCLDTRICPCLYSVPQRTLNPYSSTVPKIDFSTKVAQHPSYDMRTSLGSSEDAVADTSSTIPNINNEKP